jgi:hypothetical protein
MAMYIPLLNVNERAKSARHLPLPHASSLKPYCPQRRICGNSTITDIAAAIEPDPKRSSIGPGEYWQRERPSSILTVQHREMMQHRPNLCVGHIYRLGRELLLN